MFLIEENVFYFLHFLQNLFFIFSLIAPVPLLVLAYSDSGLVTFSFCVSVAATETAQQLKKTAGVPFHAKGRGLVKKIDTTSELQTQTHISAH